MGNCLVTKLKGVVDNPNLPKFGVFTLNLSGALAEGEQGFISVSGTVKDTNIPSLQSYINTQVSRVMLEQGVDYQGYIDYDKYSLTELGTCPGLLSDNVIRFDDIKYNALNLVGWCETTGSACKCKFKGNIATLAEIPTLGIIEFFSMNDNEELIGDISSLASLPALNRLKLRYVTHLTGDWANLLKAMCQSRTSGVFRIDGTGSSLTFKGGSSSTLFNLGQGAFLFAIFSESGCTICSDEEGTTVLHTYNKSTDTWS